MKKSIKERPLQDAIARNRGIVSSQVLIEAEARLQEIETARSADVLAHPLRTVRRIRFVFFFGALALVLLVALLITAALFIFGTVSPLPMCAVVLIGAAAWVANKIAVRGNAQAYTDDYATLVKSRKGL